MTAPLLLDTGPLVAVLNSRDDFHGWATRVLAVRAPTLTCEAVLTEAFFLLQRSPAAVAGLRAMIELGSLRVASLNEEQRSIARLMGKYATVPMSYADACMVRLAELNAVSVVATLDSDFRIYRRNGRQALSLLIAPERDTE